MMAVIDFILGMSGTDWWRVVNALMAAHVTFLLSLNTFRNRKTLTPRLRLLAQSHLALLVYVVVTSIEEIGQQNPLAYHDALASAAVLWSLIAVVGTPNQNYLTEVEPLDRT